MLINHKDVKADSEFKLIQKITNDTHLFRNAEYAFKS